MALLVELNERRCFFSAFLESPDADLRFEDMVRYLSEKRERFVWKDLWRLYATHVPNRTVSVVVYRSQP